MGCPFLEDTPEINQTGQDLQHCECIHIRHIIGQPRMSWILPMDSNRDGRTSIFDFCIICIICALRTDFPSQAIALSSTYRCGEANLATDSSDFARILRGMHLKFMWRIPN